MQVSFDSLEATRLSPDVARRHAELARHEVGIAVGRATLAVRFSNAGAAAAFAKRFGDMRGAGAPTSIAYAVDLANESYFWVAPDRARRWPAASTCDLTVFFADNLAMHEYLTTSDDLGFHAAVIGNGTTVAALVGTSTAGKTTTAVAAVRRGLRVYSDERCVIQDGMVVPFLRAITIRDGGRALLLEAESANGTIGERLRAIPTSGDAAFSPRDLFGERAGGPPRRLATIFSIESRGDTPAVEPCAVTSILPSLLRSMASRDIGLDRAARLIATLRDVPIFRLRLGTPDATAAAIERTLADVGAAIR